MRTGLALLLGLMLAVQPAMAQGKTKSSPVEEAVAALGVCESFAKGDVMAVDAAIAAGWDAYDQDAESPFIRSYAATREIPGMGWGDVFALVESYPQATLGYCRLDVAEPKGAGEAVIAALAALERYQGNVETENGGSYASLKGSDNDNTLLITHWDDVGFVIQLTIITPKNASSE
ncbi:hypothetical protein NIM87_11120 [Devosia sp. XJ19-1]|uniref:SnoaL-like domain-containing protein n=1 Tax=Devosia ureilytica TaxID=2952754 RepID=A0A9Q4FST6_9HYPH|nr:hypothetical protein [Devosia ureilytica]MCP8884054.1 hypothetical protein [Devosia ureilytica]MCP8887662.1 hypothetical protein [Devosia ureilytica]